MRLFIYGLSAVDKIDKVAEFFIVIFTIVILVEKFKDIEKYNINIEYICLANIFLLVVITTLDGIKLLVSLVIAT